MPYVDDLALARQLADVADHASLPRFGALDLRVETKPDLTPVSDADRAVEIALRELLAIERPDDAILGEEYGESAPSGAAPSSASALVSSARRDRLSSSVSTSTSVWLPLPSPMTRTVTGVPSREARAMTAPQPSVSSSGCGAMMSDRRRPTTCVRSRAIEINNRRAR